MKNETRVTSIQPVADGWRIAFLDKHGEAAEVPLRALCVFEGGKGSVRMGYFVGYQTIATNLQAWASVEGVQEHQILDVQILAPGQSADKVKLVRAEDAYYDRCMRYSKGVEV